MIQEGIIHGTTSPPLREQISQWSIAALITLPAQTIQNAWTHGDYSWFPNEGRTTTDETEMAMI